MNAHTRRIAEVLAARIEAKGMSARALALAVGLAPNMVQSYVRGASSIHGAKLERLVVKLGWTLREFYQVLAGHPPEAQHALRQWAGAIGLRPEHATDIKTLQRATLDALLDAGNRRVAALLSEIDR